jgi:hypothetical protein
MFKFKRKGNSFDIQSMMTASSVRETRGRKAKLDAGLQKLSRVTTANETIILEIIFLKTYVTKHSVNCSHSIYFLNCCVQT